MSKIPGMLHKVLGSMSQELTDNPLGIWDLGVWVISTFYKHVAPLGLKNGESPQTIDIALRPDKSGFKATGAQALTASPFYRHIAPPERKIESLNLNDRPMDSQH